MGKVYIIIIIIFYASFIFYRFLIFVASMWVALRFIMEYSIEVHNWRNKWDICSGIGTSLIFNVFIDTLLQWAK